MLFKLILRARKSNSNLLINLKHGEILNFRRKMPNNSFRCGCLLYLVRVWLSPLSRSCAVVSSLSCVCGCLLSLVRVRLSPLSRACVVFSSLSCVCGSKKLFLSFFYCFLFLQLLYSVSKLHTEPGIIRQLPARTKNGHAPRERESDPSDTPHLAELTRQMTLPTENGHAAPPVESRKS